MTVLEFKNRIGSYPRYAGKVSGLRDYVILLQTYGKAYEEAFGGHQNDHQNLH